MGDEVKLQVTGVQFVNGNTGTWDMRQFTNHPGDRLNVFRYLDGGAMSVGAGSQVYLKNCEFNHNHAIVCGGAISNLGGYVGLQDCVFSDNTCGDTGAAVDILTPGSLAVIDSCRFQNNMANQLGMGTFGAVTAFPDTYLLVQGSTFSGSGTAIDYRPNERGETFVYISRNNRFDQPLEHAIVTNPRGNNAMSTVLSRSMRIFAQHPLSVKLEGVPRGSEDIMNSHRALYEKQRAEMEC